jgi:predicted CxxxxCH...CXXCH cytochrome family protein
VYPNIAGAHSTHIALTSAGTPISCDTCHNGLGGLPSTLNHYNRAKSRVPPGDVLFLATYNAQSGASSFDNTAALSCSNVSCHGGKTTPNWRTGAIDVNTQCTDCHTTGTTTQFNGPTSSNHNRSEHQVACTTCHNPTALAVNHFTTLSTPALEGPASATIGGFGIISYVPATRSCTPACHGNETW